MASFKCNPSPWTQINFAQNQQQLEELQSVLPDLQEILVAEVQKEKQRQEAKAAAQNKKSSDKKMSRVRPHHWVCSIVAYRRNGMCMTV
jgi:hypothetical protein